MHNGESFGSLFIIGYYPQFIRPVEISADLGITPCQGCEDGEWSVSFFIGRHPMLEYCAPSGLILFTRDV
jgi:hypothetical protein